MKMPLLIKKLSLNTSLLKEILIIPKSLLPLMMCLDTVYY